MGMDHEQLIAIKSGGQNLRQLTDFCRELAAKGITDEFDDDDDILYGNLDDFHHPFEVKDKPGVLSSITNRFAKYKISVKRIIQTPDKKNNKATIAIITHKTTEANAKICLSVFRKNNNILKYPTLIRLYN